MSFGDTVQTLLDSGWNVMTIAKPQFFNLHIRNNSIFQINAIGIKDEAVMPELADMAKTNFSTYRAKLVVHGLTEGQRDLLVSEVKRIVKAATATNGWYDAVDFDLAERQDTTADAVLYVKLKIFE